MKTVFLFGIEVIIICLLILWVKSPLSCGAEEKKPLFKWDTRIRACITGSHMATTIQVSLVKGVERKTIINEIVGYLKTSDLSEQMIDGFVIRDALQKTGLRDADALALALSSLTKQTFEINDFSDSKERDRAIREFVDNYETKMKEHRLILLLTFAVSAITVLSFIYWLGFKSCRKT